MTTIQAAFQQPNFFPLTNIANPSNMTTMCMMRVCLLQPSVTTGTSALKAHK